MEKVLSFNSNFGWISITENNGNIESVSFNKSNNIGNSKKLIKLKKEIINYFLNKNKTFNTNVELLGTKLQVKIWNELKKISFGKTKSYGEIAKKFNTSPRYIGNVCSKNKHLLIIPCHRVIRSDGKLGGFSAKGGLKLKEKLLKLEK